MIRATDLVLDRSAESTHRIDERLFQEHCHVSSNASAPA
jgi:hypothetical protein